MTTTTVIILILVLAAFAVGILLSVHLTVKRMATDKIALMEEKYEEAMQALATANRTMADLNESLANAKSLIALLKEKTTQPSNGNQEEDKQKQLTKVANTNAGNSSTNGISNTQASAASIKRIPTHTDVTKPKNDTQVIHNTNSVSGNDVTQTNTVHASLPQANALFPKTITTNTSSTKNTETNTSPKDSLIEGGSVIDELVKLTQLGVQAPENLLLRMADQIEKDAPGFYEAVNSNKVLKDFEYRICMLIRYRFKPIDICNLLGASTAQVTMSRKRLLKKIFNVEGKAAEFDNRIQNI